MSSPSKQQLAYIATIIIVILAAIWLLVSDQAPNNQRADGTSSTATTTARTSTTTNSDARSDDSYRISVATSTQETENFSIVSEIPKGSSTLAETARDYLRSRESEFTRFIAETVTQGTSTYQPDYTFSAELQTYQTSRYVSLVYKINEYTGGANANTSVKTFVLDKTSDQIVDLSDVVQSEGLSDFVANVRAQLRGSDTDDAARPQAFSGAVDDLSLSDINHFYITGNHIVVLFSPYSVAPGAAGVVSAQIDR
jgi:hypothetical protein